MWDVNCFRDLQGGHDSEAGPRRSLSNMRTLGTVGQVLQAVTVGKWQEGHQSHRQSSCTVLRVRGAPWPLTGCLVLWAVF